MKPKMDWGNVDEVKELVFDLMLENRQLGTMLAKSRLDEKYWFEQWQEANEQNQNLRAELDHLRGVETKMSADSAIMA